jgi:hypothetical protein
MEQAEFVALAKTDPNRLVLMIEHGKLNPEDLIVACRVAGYLLPTKKIQRVLLRHLACVTSPRLFDSLVDGLSKHHNAVVTETLQRLADSISNPEIRRKAAELLLMDEWDGMEPEDAAIDPTDD